jgi:ABC-type Mn2+/Zn2+ transport system permease subunit
MEFFLVLLMSAFVGGVAGYLGTLMLSKRMALIAGPLGHLTLPGITLALLYNFDVSLGAFLFVVLGILFIWLIELRTKLPMEAITAIVFASGVAISFLFLPEDKTVPALIGDVSQISAETVVITAIFSIVTFLATKKVFSKMVLVSISEDLARVEGVDTKKLNFIYLGCIAVVVSLGVRIVGGLMTAAIIAIPACTSRNLSKNLLQYSYGGMILGSLGCILGVVSAEFIMISAGPSIIIMNTLLFLVSLIPIRNIS